MSNPLEVIILAAGQGTRMKSALPKVLHPLAGRPLLAHVIDTAEDLSPSRVHVVYGHGGGQVREALAGRQVQWVEQSEQLGTGHAVEQAMPGVSDEAVALVLYGDVPLVQGDTLQQLMRSAAQGDLALLTVMLDNPFGYGRIVRDEAGHVQRIVEEKDASAEEKAISEGNTGILAVGARRLRAWLQQLDNANAQGEFYLTDIIALAVADGVAVDAVTAHDPDEVLGVNDRVQLAHLERVYQARQAEAQMRAGVTLTDPARFDLRGELSCGRDVHLEPNVICEGRVVLGDGVRVGANCVLRDMEAGAGSEILPMSVVEGAVIGSGCSIGPFARIRPGTQLADGTKAGNFVEIKKSSIGAGSKVNHLSYIGDTEMGAGVNIGAGTITCNYDGANKHRTVIGDNAFIGSDTQLVAPVAVGEGATIGAGSTITRDTPPGELTLSRSKQQSIKGWKRPVKKGSDK